MEAVCNVTSKRVKVGFQQGHTDPISKFCWSVKQPNSVPLIDRSYQGSPDIRNRFPEIKPMPVVMMLRVHRYISAT